MQEGPSAVHFLEDLVIYHQESLSAVSIDNQNGHTNNLKKAYNLEGFEISKYHDQ